MNTQQLERRVKRLEEKVLNKRSLNEARQILNFYESAFDINLPLIMDPLMEYWGLEGNWWDYEDVEDLSFITYKAMIAKAPSYWEYEEHSFVDVEKFAKLVTKKFVEDGHIDKSFLRKPLPKFDIPKEKPELNVKTMFKRKKFLKNLLNKFNLRFDTTNSNIRKSLIYTGREFTITRSWYGNFGSKMLNSENEVISRFEIEVGISFEKPNGEVPIYFYIRDFKKIKNKKIEDSFEKSDPNLFKRIELFFKEVDLELTQLKNIPNEIDPEDFKKLKMPEILVNEYINKLPVLKSLNIEKRNRKFSGSEDYVSFYLGSEKTEGWGPLGFFDGRLGTIFSGVIFLNLKNKPTRKNLIYEFELEFKLREIVKISENSNSISSRDLYEKSIFLNYIPGQEKEFSNKFSNFLKQFIPLHKKISRLNGKQLELRFRNDPKELPF